MVALKDLRQDTSSGKLKWISEAGSQAGVPVPVTSRRRSRERLWMVATILLALVTAALAVSSFRRPASRAMRAHILPPTDAYFRAMGASAAPVVISPDGRTVVFGATTLDGRNMLWVRSLDAIAPRPLPGTEAGTRPFWSPDSRFIGFFANGKLKKIALHGGPALSIADASDGRGGTWNRDDVIVFAPSYRDPQLRIPAAGGEPIQISELDASRNEGTHRYPHFLPDGRHFLYLSRVRGQVRGEETAVFIASLESEENQLLLHVNSNVVYASGHILFVRERTLMAQDFDADSLVLTGDAYPVAESVQYDSNYSRGVFSVS